MEEKKVSDPVRAGVVLIGGYQSGKSTLGGHLLHLISPD